MKKAKKKSRRVLRTLCILLLAVCLLAGTGVGIYFQKGDWLFSVEQAFVRYETPDLTPLFRFEGETQPLSEWLADERVTTSYLLMLVNASHPLPEGYEANLTEYNGARMHPLMVENYVALRDAVQAKTGVRIYVSSDFRTSEEQEQIIAESEAGIAAPVGCSEHEAGFALDVYAPYFAGMEFLRSPAGREVNRVCSKYGFVIRYQKDKTDITGISWEPWHLRYVGAPHAEIMAKSGLSYEEYVDYLTPEVWFSHGDYLILRTAAETLTLPDEWQSCHISPDNTGYYIVTLKIR